MSSTSLWLKVHAVDPIEGYTSTKCITVNIINEPPSFSGPFYVEIGVRDISLLPLQETEVKINIFDPENNTNSFVADL